ncbi:radical SAM enzyme, TIGR04100 family [Clostridium sp. DSM 8431]|uniref:TatD family nuclease-associated radical SAM protein n=1 Tax=Clostridium sp. DSM 8431 TaxID=1761781 RepID=UPI0008EC43F8|nr:TatD family nuclease-associated radical SAM protein [Clostridium sp. DSM 8431]SFU83707.1 radical SAM enzyme, TIGR04100 family [Clostridium sp. DSM 8431]
MVILYTADNGKFISLKNITLEEMEAKNIKKNVYVNLTNKCPCACTFCLRKTKEMLESNSLWLKREPTISEVIEEFESIDLPKFDEVIFCGFGEPSERIYDIVKIAKYIKERCPNMPTRINTNGLSDLVNNKPTAHILKGLIDTVSISLNAPNADEFLEITQNKFGIKSYEAMKKFALACKNYVPNVVFTVVDCIGEEKIKESQAVCDELGIKLRVRAFEE